MDERWYVEAQSDIVSARRELIMLCMAMAVVPDVVPKDAAEKKEGLAVPQPPPFQPLTLEMDSGDEGYFVDGYREKNLNSPDSNDSGIQADTLSFQHLLSDRGLYGVVKKPPKKTVTNATEDHYRLEESVERFKELLDHTSKKSNDIPPVSGNKRDEDPYSMAELDSPDEASNESTYAMIQAEKKVLRINEQTDDDDGGGDEVTECDDNGNHFPTNDSNGKGNHDKLSDSSDLPEGWQRHEDEHGSYYWHIKSGITQRELPSPVHEKPLHSTKTSKAKTFHPVNGDIKAKDTIEKDLHELSAVTNVKAKPRGQNVSDAKLSSQTRFLVQCLGSLPLTEDQLSDDKSGRAISQCISSLSHQPSGSLEAGRLQGQHLSLEFSGEELLLTDVSTDSLVHSDYVKSIRVWGVGREKDSQDFAYIARDPALNKHFCWVFKCERSGDEIATVLRSVCLRILKENERFSEKKSNSNRLNNRSGNHLVYESHISKESPKNHSKNNQSKKNWNDQSEHWNECSSFPLPMNESKNILGCHYLGMVKVPKPIGMDILNDAIEMIYAGVPSSKWVSVLFEVAPSAVRVYDRGNADSMLLECRIRFLTFLGIGVNNCRLGAFIMHSAENEFFAHVFHCSPDAGLFCQTIRAACKLRYQKCLDAESQKNQEQNKIALQTSSTALIPFQGLKESLQKGINNLFRINGKKHQLKG